MLKIYDLANNIDILSTPRITASKGRFETSDPRVQRILSRYPGVTLISVEPDAQAPCAGGEVAGTHSPAAPAETVRTVPGIQFKPTRERGGRVVDAD